MFSGLGILARFVKDGVAVESGRFLGVFVGGGGSGVELCEAASGVIAFNVFLLERVRIKRDSGRATALPPPPPRPRESDGMLA